MVSNYESSSCFGSILSLEQQPQIEPVKTLSVITDTNFTYGSEKTTSTVGSIRTVVRNREASQSCKCLII